MIPCVLRHCPAAGSFRLFPHSEPHRSWSTVPNFMENSPRSQVRVGTGIPTPRTGTGGSSRGFPPRPTQHPRTPGTARHGHIPTRFINKRQWTGQQFPTPRKSIGLVCCHSRREALEPVDRSSAVALNYCFELVGNESGHRMCEGMEGDLRRQHHQGISRAEPIHSAAPGWRVPVGEWSPKRLRTGDPMPVRSPETISGRGR